MAFAYGELFYRVDEVEIERRVDELRQKLLANLAAEANSARRAFKPSDTHAMAVAKKTELEKMARALGTRGDYQEGDAFDREKQEEARQRRIVEREEREKERLEKAKKREEDRKRMEEQRKRWQEERRKKDEEERDQRRNKDDRDKDRRRDDRGAMPPPDIPRREQPSRDRDREFSRRSPPHKYGSRGDRRDPLPRRNDTSSHVAEAVRKRDRDSLSRSPPPRARRRVHSRSLSTSRSTSTDSGTRRRRSASRSPSRLPQRGKEETYARDTVRDRGDGRHRELPPRGSPSPMRGIRRGGRPVSRSVSPPFRSRSPPLHNARRRDDDRSLRSRSRSPRVPSRLGPSGKGKRGYTPRTPSRSPTPPPPTRRERDDQLPPTGPSYVGPKGVQRGKERGRTRSQSASSGSSMSVSSRSASGSRSG